MARYLIRGKNGCRIAVASATRQSGLCRTFGGKQSHGIMAQQVILRVVLPTKKTALQRTADMSGSGQNVVGTGARYFGFSDVPWFMCLK
ncbi:MAG: hypothetical protein PHO83_11135 [Geobacteraceae bacterium]|nr:hypothetical protein [Geobacteraceae bacterium]